MTDARRLYTQRADQYVAFASSFRHEAGLAEFLHVGRHLKDGIRVLDAGCGTGYATLALVQALGRRGLSARKIDAFDLTPAMLERFERNVRDRGLQNIEIRQADVRDLTMLSPTWNAYDLIISVSMLEYVQRHELAGSLRGLRERLAPGGILVVVITRKNPITWLLIEKAWQANRYSRRELASAFEEAGFRQVRFARYPIRYFWLSFSNHIVVASNRD